MSRPREFEPSEALDRAMALFWRKGYTGTSLDDLVAGTGVSRYGLYSVFGNKRELFRKALRRYWEHLSRQVHAGLLSPETSLPEIQRAFENVATAAATTVSGRGCMLCNTATEVAPRDKKVAAEVRELFGKLTALFERALRNAKRRGELPKGLDAEAWARHLTASVQSLGVMAAARYPGETLRSHVAHVLGLLVKP